jgi:hypothetical protein
LAGRYSTANWTASKREGFLTAMPASRHLVRARARVRVKVKVRVWVRARVRVRVRVGVGIG